MSREILFRGKQIDNEEWEVGGVFSSKDYTGIIVNAMRWVEVDPETVCQYAGLTDKNGKRYEGDIFQASDGEYIQRYIIKWNEDSLEWSAECIGDPDGTLPLSEFRVEEIEVIGNIFDNPELLEREQIMTENEAIKVIETEKQCVLRNNENGCDRDCICCDLVMAENDIICGYDTAIKAIEEIQQYRAIGTIEECREAMERQKP